MKKRSDIRRDGEGARRFAAKRSEIPTDPGVARAFVERGRRSSAESLERSRGGAPKRRTISPASKAQRDAAALATVCEGCGRERSEVLTLDPAHLCPRGRGGCDHELCTPCHLCRTFDGSGCHRLFDEGGLSLLAKVNAEPDRYRQALQHALEHMNVVELVERLAGARTQWADTDPRAQRPCRSPVGAEAITQSSIRSVVVGEEKHG